MAILPLVIAPDERLTRVSEPVGGITQEIRRLAADMLETMYANHGIGLAAVQVGVLKRLIVVDVEWPSPRYEGEDMPPEPAQADSGGESPAPALQGKPIVLINPEIIDATGEMSLYNEGCLSFPDQYSEVERPAAATIRYTDLDGRSQSLRATGLLATCIQHEIDHINGVVFVDHISRLKRERILKKLAKQKKLGTLPAPKQSEEARL